MEEAIADNIKAEVADRLGRVYESFMSLGSRSMESGQYKDSAAAFQLAGNVAITIASIREQPSSPQNNLAASIDFEDDE